MLYEDFPQLGLVLIRPSSLNYHSLVSKIKVHSSYPLYSKDPPNNSHVSHHPDLPEKLNNSVIFKNTSNLSVVLLHIAWRFRMFDGSEITGAQAHAGSETLLLPFDFFQEPLPALKYREAILPGSQRYITNSGVVVGDNRDVRAPAPEELWAGGLVSGYSGGSWEPSGYSQLRISIDGAFFENGDFAGTNASNDFERVAASLKAHKYIGGFASSSRASPCEVLDSLKAHAIAVATMKHAPSNPETQSLNSVLEIEAFERIAAKIETYRSFRGDRETLTVLEQWASNRTNMLRKVST